MAIPTPPPSPLSPLSSPLPHISSLPLPLLSPPPTDPTYEEAPLGYRAAILRWRAGREEILEEDMPLQKREPVRDNLYRFVVTVERGDGSMPASIEVGYGITDAWDDLISDYRQDAAGGDQGVAGRRLEATGTVYTGTDYIEVMSDSADCSSRTHLDLRGHESPAWPEKMATKRTTKANPATTTTTTTTSVIDAQLEALIERTKRVTRECTYPYFMKCQPLNFKGTEGVVELIQWLEKMETVFRIRNCCVENQIKFCTCTLFGSALTGWNAHVITVGPDVSYEMTWVDLKKKMTDKYYPRSEIKKLKSELWNLRVKGNDVVSYNQRFQELALLCVRMFPEESDKIERYVGGLPDVIHESVVASRPKTMQEAIEMANELMDKRNNTLAESQAKNKRKFDDTSRNNQSQQQQ
nr:reverse transcriptase domain-containing protein [Tanacetum cinerariifolium]